MERDGWKLILLSQLHPLFPSSLMNYLYGLTKIRFRTCMADVQDIEATIGRHNALAFQAQPPRFRP